MGLTKKATIHQLAVAVHVLRIGEKQVTQAVFKQLPIREVWCFGWCQEDPEDESTGYVVVTPDEREGVDVWGYVVYQAAKVGYGLWVLWFDPATKELCRQGISQDEEELCMDKIKHHNLPQLFIAV